MELLSTKMEKLNDPADFGEIRALVWGVLSQRCLVTIAEEACGYMCLEFSRVIWARDINLRAVGIGGV